MGYDIVIGERVRAGRDAKECGREFEVERVELAHAPCFDLDDLTGHSNHRAPSYTVWGQFADEVGLHDFFFGTSGVMRDHPGVELLAEAHLKTVRKAVERWGRSHQLPPGWGQGQDPQKARLIWLEWWIDWALRTCKVPAIENS